MSYTLANKIQKTALKGGGDMYFFPFGISGVVTLVGSVAGGHLAAKDPVLADLHASLLTEGTKRTSKKLIQETLDALGATIVFSALQNRLQFTVRCPKNALPPVLALLGEMLSVPLFSPAEIAVMKKQFEGALQTEAENTRAQAGIAFAQLVYEKSHPNAADSTKVKQAALKKITRAHLFKFHTHFHGRSSLLVSASGDTDLKQLARLLEKSFAGLSKNSARTLVSNGKIALRTGGSEVVHIPGKASVDYILGTRLYIQKTDADYPALVLGSRILGNRGFTGRLMRIVREQEGLTYGVYAHLGGFEAGADGDLIIWGTFAPNLFARGRASVRRELNRLLTKGFDAKEFKVHQNLMLANWYVNLSNTGALANAMHTAVLEEGTVQFLDAFPNQIRSLNPEDVLAALKKHVNISGFAEAAAGTVEKDALSS